MALIFCFAFFCLFLCSDVKIREIFPPAVHFWNRLATRWTTEVDSLVLEKVCLHHLAHNGLILLCIFCTMCMKWMHIGLIMSVCLSAWLSSRTAWRIWMKFGVSVMPLGYTLKLHFAVSYSRLYHRGRRTNLWRGIDISAACSGVVQWCLVMVVDFRKIQDFDAIILYVLWSNYMATARKKNKFSLDLDSMWGPYATTALTRRVTCYYWFTVLKKTLRPRDLSRWKLNLSKEDSGCNLLQMQN